METFAPDERPLLESNCRRYPAPRSCPHPPRLGHLDRLVTLLGDPPGADAETRPLALRREQLVEIDQWLAESVEAMHPP